MRARCPSAPWTVPAAVGAGPRSSIPSAMPEYRFRPAMTLPRVVAWQRILGKSFRSANAEGRFVESHGGKGENLAPGLGDPDHMLELRRQAAIAGHGGPAVLQDLHLRSAGIH